MDRACLSRILSEALESLWSRSPTAGEMQRWLDEAVALRAELEPTETLVTLFRQALLSPEFLFRSELGSGGRLSPEERAAGIALALTEAPPDVDLWRAAHERGLETPEQVKTEVQRLLLEPEHLPSLRRFLGELLTFDASLSVAKDGARFPWHHPAVLVDDTRRVVDALVKDHARSGLLRALLTSDLVFVRPSTRQSWDVAASTEVPEDGTFLHDPRRAGILTHPAWLIAQSDNFDNSPIHRGKWIREKLLGAKLPEIPITVDAQLPEEPHNTLRERMRVTRETYCWKCHVRMDPLGLPFEMYDHFGRYRETDLDKPVETSGQLEGTGDAKLDGPVQNAVELIERLAKSERVEQVFVRHVFRYFIGRNETSADGPTLVQAHRAYAESGGSLQALLASLLSSPALLERTTDTPAQP